MRRVTTRVTLGANYVMWPARDWAKGTTVLLTRRRDWHDAGREGCTYNICRTTSHDASTRNQELTFKAVVVRIARRRCYRRGGKAMMMMALDNNYHNNHVEC